MLAGTKNLQPIDNPIGSRLSPMSPVRSVTYVSGPDRRLRGGAGRTRTNHQSVMEYGRVRPAHPVGHQTSSSKRPAVDGHFYKRESRVAVTRHGKSRCSPHDGSVLPPRRHHHWALPLLLRQLPTTGEVAVGTWCSTR